MTIAIYRKIGDGGETLLATVAVTGSCEFEGNGLNDHVISQWVGSTSITDTSLAGQDVRYRALMTAFEHQTVYGDITDQTISQSLKLTSKEGA